LFAAMTQKVDVDTKKSPAIVGPFHVAGNVKFAYSVVHTFVVFIPLWASDLVL
jgi:hypothetical protein